MGGGPSRRFNASAGGGRIGAARPADAKYIGGQSGTGGMFSGK